MVGASAPDDPVIVLASDLAIVELVDDENRPVPAGTPSAKALITNLFNTAQPLIRYELNDCLVRQPDAPDHGHVRVTIEGRTDDTLRYGDVTVHPLAIRSTLLAVPAVVEYQVTQTRCGIHVDVVAPDGIDEPSLSRSLRSALDRAGLADPEVTVTSIDSIERITASGKIRRFVLLPDSG